MQQLWKGGGGTSIVTAQDGTANGPSVYYLDNIEFKPEKKT